MPVEECLLLPEKYRRAPKALGGALRYIAGEQDLGLTRVALRVGANTRDVEVALWGAPGPFPRRPVATTLGQALRTTSLVRVLVKGPAKERKIAGVEVLSGKGAWRERLLGTTMTVSAPSFFQVNTRAAESLVSLALEALGADGSDRVLDLYAGAGTFTLPLAEKAGEVVAVESASSAVRDLRRNLEDEGLWADVIGGDAGRELPAIGHIDLALVDPPRAGLHAEAVASAGADPGPTDRLRLVRPGDARARRRAPGRARLRARRGHAGRPVPADVPRRDRRAVRAHALARVTGRRQVRERTARPTQLETHERRPVTTGRRS